MAEPKKKQLKTAEVSSIFDLKSELARKKNEAIRQGHNQYDDSYSASGYASTGVLTVKKEERIQQKQESKERKRRLDKLQEEITKEEAEQQAKQRLIMEEKAKMYDEMKNGNVLLRDDGTPVDFLVDFAAKKREESSIPSGREEERPMEKESLVERHEASEDRRVYGVSHVQFSHDEKMRAEQMKALLDLSAKATEERQKVKEEKRKVQSAELEKANRLRERLGKKPLPGKPSLGILRKMVEEREPTPEPEIDLNAIPLPTDRVERRPETEHKEREWDKGKGSYHRWVEKQRDERNDDFRPPDSYYRAGVDVKQDEKWGQMEVSSAQKSPAPTPVLAWSELLAHCRLWRSETRRSMSPAFSHLAFVPRQSLLLALGSPVGAPSQTLVAASLDTPNLNGSVELRPAISAQLPSAALTTEFALSCERQRTLVTAGVVDYSVSSPSELLLSNGHSFFSFSLGSASPVLISQGSDAVASPVDSSLIAYVHDKQLHLRFGERLLFSTSESSSNISNGVASFIVQEELDRYSGYWWSPSKKRLLYERVDENGVKELNFTLPGHPPSQPMRYPLAGTPNPITELRQLVIIETEVQSVGLHEPLSHIVPWVEYVARGGFLRDGCTVWLLVTNRLQSRIGLLLLPPSSFGLNEQGSVAAPVLVYEETTDAWINKHNLTQTLPSKDSSIRFLLGSQRDDHLHLYHLTADVDVTGNVVATSLYPVTKGNFSAMRQPVSKLDVQRELVYFVSNMNHPTETCLCVAHYGRTGEVRSLTEGGLSVRMDGSELCVSEELGFVCWLSSLIRPPECRFYALVHSPDDPLPRSEFHCRIEMPGSSLDFRIPPTENSPRIFEFLSETSGEKHFALVIHPPGFSSAFKYPVLQYVYGGPSAQVVRNGWAAWVHLQKFAELGYVVIAIDGRGSDNRGMRFQAWLKNELGPVEVEGLEAVDRLLGRSLDRSRVAVFGWSYGGFMALQLLARHSEVYRAAIAGAAVTDWSFYDTCYTERYIGIPPSPAYDNSSVIKLVDKLPNEFGRLLLVHGMSDENVHFRHAEALIEAMLKSQKPYELQVFPAERHGVRNLESAEHLDAFILTFLARALV